MEIVEEIPATIDLSIERPKPRLIALLFCDFMNMTGDKKANLLGIFDRVYVRPDSILTPRFSVFVRTAETHETPIRTTVYAPDGTAIAQFTSVSTTEEFIPDLPKNIQAMFNMQFNAHLEGVYWFDVSVGGQSLGGAGLVVEYRKEGEKKRGTDTYP